MATIKRLSLSYFKEETMRLFFFLSALLAIFAIILICMFLFIAGVPLILKVGLFKFLFGTSWAPVDVPPEFGIFPFIIGSICATAGAIVLGVPTGILTAVFMVKICNKKVYKLLKPIVDLLVGIPSIVYGFFGIVVVVPVIKEIFGGNGQSILAVAILLGIMILPTVISIAENAIRAVPNYYYEGALALGASRWRSLFFVVLPAAKSGLLAAVVLGTGRAIGETVAVKMVAGNQAVLPSSVLSGFRTLTANIVMEMGYAQGLHRDALIATGVALFVFILLINLSFSLMKRKTENE